MKITKLQLRKIVKEELGAVVHQRREEDSRRQADEWIRLRSEALKMWERCCADGSGNRDEIKYISKRWLSLLKIARRLDMGPRTLAAHKKFWKDNILPEIKARRPGAGVKGGPIGPSPEDLAADKKRRAPKLRKKRRRKKRTPKTLDQILNAPTKKKRRRKKKPQSLEDILGPMDETMGGGGLYGQLEDIALEAHRIWGGEKSEESMDFAKSIAKSTIDLVDDKSVLVDKLDSVAKIVATRLCTEYDGGSKSECWKKYIPHAGQN
tara:strand:- start:3368 stop:4162 length:795 start_codon:yes stop_codon:yes gene_type:complete